MDHPQELHISVGVRDDEPSRMALEWALSEFATPDNAPHLLFTLIHVVSDVHNTRGKRVRVSEADQQSVAHHVCENVLPFLENLQDLCDLAEVTSSIEVVKNDLRPEALIEASMRLQVGYLILGGSANTTTWGTIAYCMAPGKQPPGCTVMSVVNGKKLKEMSGTGSMVLSSHSFSPSSVLGVIESEAEGGSTPSSFCSTPNGSSSFGNVGMLPLGPSPLAPGSVSRREKWRNRGKRMSKDSREPPEADMDMEDEAALDLAPGQPIEDDEELSPQNFNSPAKARKGDKPSQWGASSSSQNQWGASDYYNNQSNSPVRPNLPSMPTIHSSPHGTPDRSPKGSVDSLSDAYRKPTLPEMREEDEESVDEEGEVETPSEARKLAESEESDEEEKRETVVEAVKVDTKYKEEEEEEEEEKGEEKEEVLVEGKGGEEKLEEEEVGEEEEDEEEEDRARREQMASMRGWAAGKAKEEEVAALEEDEEEKNEERRREQMGAMRGWESAKGKEGEASAELKEERMLKSVAEGTNGEGEKEMNGDVEEPGDSNVDVEVPSDSNVVETVPAVAAIQEGNQQGGLVEDEIAVPVVAKALETDTAKDKELEVPAVTESEAPPVVVNGDLRELEHEEVPNGIPEAEQVEVTETVPAGFKPEEILRGSAAHLPGGEPLVAASRAVEEPVKLGDAEVHSAESGLDLGSNLAETQELDEGTMNREVNSAANHAEYDGGTQGANHQDVPHSEEESNDIADVAKEAEGPSEPAADRNLGLPDSHGSQNEEVNGAANGAENGALIESATLDSEPNFPAAVAVAAAEQIRTAETPADVQAEDQSGDEEPPTPKKGSEVKLITPKEDDEEDAPVQIDDGLTPLQRARLAYRAGHPSGTLTQGSRSMNSEGSGEANGGKVEFALPPPSITRAAKMSGKLAAKANLPTSMGGRGKMDRKAKEDAEVAVGRAIRESLGQSNIPLMKPRVVTDFRVYTLKELQVAMDHFWPNHILGEGSYGIVYHGLLEGQDVAIKQLKNPDHNASMEEIDRELEVQKRCNHQNLVRLLGYSVEDRSLVYEYLSQGSLEDRLLCMGGSPPLLWPDRCRIAMEVAAALHHLHTRPPPIVHRDVKPANVLLDDHFVAKLGDVGLARLMEDMANGNTHIVRKSVIVGTEHYVDPEYLCARRGYLGPKSDVYSFGIVLLQLLVGGIPNLRKIDLAVEQENLKALLDPRAGDWPVALAMDMANLGLWCSEMDRKDRPDLEEEVIPALLEICEAAAQEVVEQEVRKEAARTEAKAKEEALAVAKEEAARIRAAEEAAEAERLAKERHAEEEARARHDAAQRAAGQRAAAAVAAARTISTPPLISPHKAPYQGGFQVPEPEAAPPPEAPKAAVPSVPATEYQEGPAPPNRVAAPTPAPAPTPVPAQLPKPAAAPKPAPARAPEPAKAAGGCGCVIL